MFRYNKVDERKPMDKKVGFVNGWREKELLKTLNKSNLDNQRKFIIKLNTGLEIEVDIHFVESFMKSMNLGGYLYVGYDAKNIKNKPKLLDVESVKPFIEYLRKHNDEQYYKMPKGSLDVMMALFLEGQNIYEAIQDFEKGNPEIVEKYLKEKQSFQEKNIDDESNQQLQRLTDEMQSKIDYVEEYYGEIIATAKANNNLKVSEKMEKEILPNKIEKILDEYGADVNKITERAVAKRKGISERNYNTYSFFIEDFDLLVAKIGKNKLRYRTIYADDFKEPQNVFLYIPDYGEEVKKTSIPKF